MNASKLPIDLKYYKAPLTLRGWVRNNWHWILLAGYFGLAYFGGSHV